MKANAQLIECEQLTFHDEMSRPETSWAEDKKREQP